MSDVARIKIHTRDLGLLLGDDRYIVADDFHSSETAFTNSRSKLDAMQLTSQIFRAIVMKIIKYVC